VFIAGYVIRVQCSGCQRVLRKGGRNGEVPGAFAGARAGKHGQRGAQEQAGLGIRADEQIVDRIQRLAGHITELIVNGQAKFGAGLLDRFLKGWFSREPFVYGDAVDAGHFSGKSNGVASSEELDDVFLDWFQIGKTG
jgi:hypothetical protein